MAGLIQNEDHKSEAEIVTAGGTKAQLLNDTKIYVTGNSINKTLDDAIVDGDIGGGGAATDVIYVDDDFETGVTDYTASATGLTVSQETTNPLIGTGSLKIAKDAVNRTGVYVHRADFTIDEGYQHSMLTLTFNATTSTSYADEDIKPVIYDVENSQEIAVIPEGLLAGESGKYSGQFQTAAFSGGANEGDYELRFVVNSTNALAYDVIIDNVKIAPTQFAYGAVVTEWKAYTPGSTWSTNTLMRGYWRRVGDTMEIQIEAGLSGAPDAATLQVDLPSGYSIDTSKLAELYSNTISVGQSCIGDGGTALTNGPVVIIDSNTVRPRYDNGYTGGGNITNTSPITFGNGDNVSLTVTVPIAGWGGTVQLGSDAGTRVVSFRVSQDTIQTITAHTEDKIELDTVEHDTHNGWDSTNFKYVITESGKWKFLGMITNAGYSYGGSNYYYGAIQKNGSNISRFYIWVSAAATGRIDSWITSAEVDCEVNDEITLVMYQTAGSGWTTDGVTSDVYLEGHKIQGPQQIAASEKIFVDASSNNGATIGANSTVIFEDVNEDSHNSYDSSTGEFTALRSLRIDISANVVLTSNTTSYIYISKDTGSGYSNVRANYYSSQSGHSINAKINMKKGDKMKITHNAGGTLIGNSIYNYLNIESI